ncbi:MAG: hypothetical protein ACI837_002484 [Crocinitomicaceae bacterium]|jgi:hypothetical protein
MAHPKSIKDIMLKRFFNVIISLFATGSVTAGGDEPLKILFIGNSYTHMNDMPKMFDKIAKEAGLNILVEKSAQSGASFHVHSERKDMFRAIKKRKWDYVVLQGYSRELSFKPEYIDTATIPFLSKITQAIYDNNECTNVLFYMTWGYEDGFGELDELNSYGKMADSIEHGYKYISEHYDVPVVPVGMVWKDVKNSTSIDLYAEDRAHPSQEGSYLIANTFFEAIFGVPANENLSIVVEDDAAQIRKAVSNVLSKKRMEYKLDRFQFDLEVVVKEDAPEEDLLELRYSANFPGAKSILWTFPNDSVSTEWSGIYLFLNPGVQIVKIHVTDACNTIRTYHRQVIIEGVETRRQRRRKEKMKDNRDED